MSSTEIHVRPFNERNVPALLELMKGLARFEGYIDAFRVTEHDLIERGLCAQPQFEALIATRAGEEDLLGMTVLYTIPYTYDLCPSLVMKELFVTEEARGQGVGKALFTAVVARARELGCARILWTVLNGNEAAMAFYREQGGCPDEIWQGWVMSLGD